MSVVDGTVARGMLHTDYTNVGIVDDGQPSREAVNDNRHNRQVRPSTTAVKAVPTLKIVY